MSTIRILPRFSRNHCLFQAELEPPLYTLYLRFHSIFDLGLYSLLAHSQKKKVFAAIPQRASYYVRRVRDTIGVNKWLLLVYGLIRFSLS